MFSISKMDDDRYGYISRLTVLDKYRYLVDGPHDGDYMPSDNSIDLGANQVSGLEPQKDGHLHIHSPALLYPGLNTDVISEGLFQLLPQDFVSNVEDSRNGSNYRVTTLTGNTVILLSGHRTAPPCRATSTLITWVIRYPA